jgi:hypothetical protein
MLVLAGIGGLLLRFDLVSETLKPWCVRLVLLFVFLGMVSVLLRLILAIVSLCKPLFRSMFRPKDYLLEEILTPRKEELDLIVLSW